MSLQATIEAAWESRSTLNPQDAEVRLAVLEAI